MTNGAGGRAAGPGSTIGTGGRAAELGSTMGAGDRVVTRCAANVARGRAVVRCGDVRRSARPPARSAALLAAVAVALATVCGAHAAEPPAAASVPARSAYEPTPATADGIGKRYMGRQIARVMGWEGAAWLEREEREREERTDLLLPELALAPGMTVADIGAGTGYISRRMAAKVGASGTVYAVDVQPEMVRMLAQLAARDGLKQIRPVQGAAADVRLPAASLDLAIMVDVYHELEFPREVLASLASAMKPGGRIVFVEYRAEDPNVPIKALHKMSEAQVRREAEAAGFVWDRTAETLPWQHVVVFRRR